MSDQPRIAVFTVTKDRMAYTRRTFEGLHAGAGTAFDHFVVDNGSTDGTAAYLRSHPRLAAVRFNEQNCGISVAWNQALEMIGNGYDYVVKVDNDCESVTEGWLGTVIRLCEIMQRRAVLSPFVDGLRENRGGAPRYGSLTVDGHEIGLTEHLGGISLAAPAEAYEGFRLPEYLTLRGGQDHVFSTDVRRRGFTLGYVEDVSVCHMDTTEGQHARYPDYFRLADRERRTVYGSILPFAGIMSRARRHLSSMRSIGREEA